MLLDCEKSCFVILFWITAGSLTWSQEQSRTWTSADGKRTFEGKLQAASGDFATILRTSDGEQFRIEIEKLSPADRSHVMTSRKNAKMAEVPDAGPSEKQSLIDETISTSWLNDATVILHPFVKRLEIVGLTTALPNCLCGLFGNSPSHASWEGRRFAGEGAVRLVDAIDPAHPRSCPPSPTAARRRVDPPMALRFGRVKKVAQTCNRAVL